MSKTVIFEMLLHKHIVEASLSESFVCFSAVFLITAFCTLTASLHQIKQDPTSSFHSIQAFQG